MKLKPFLWLLTLGLALNSCIDASLPELTLNSETVGLNSIVHLNEDTTVVHLTDFILHPNHIDSVSLDTKALSYVLNQDKTLLTLTRRENLPAMMNLRVWLDSSFTDIPLVRSTKVNYTFVYDQKQDKIGRIQIAGQMNNWVPALTPDLKLNSDGVYAVTMRLTPGTYLYQLKIDGIQGHDRNNPNKVANGYGKFNSILQINGHEDERPRLTTDQFLEQGLNISTTHEANNIYAYWENYRLPASMVKVINHGIHITIPNQAKDFPRSYIRVWASNDFGISNDILVPLQDGAPLNNPSQLSRKDKYANMIYFMLVDRFKNGDKTNDHPMNRPDVNPKVDYFGGDLAGLQQEINQNYFNKLGMNTLWISPLTQNPWTPYGWYAPKKTKFTGYHGYWPISFSKIDQRFGTNEAFQSLVDAAHKKNLNVLMDLVANHVHELNPLYQNHPEYATPFILPDGRKNLELWDEERLTTWFDTFLPTLDYSNPEVVKLMTDSICMWVKDYGIDGYRFDACKHVNKTFWRSVTKRLKTLDPSGSLYQIGESYGSPQLMQSYVNSGMLDGQFDFNVYDEASSAFNGVSGGTLTRLSTILASSLKFYGSHNLMGYISGNHDKPRFMALASGDLKVGEDAKAAGWNRTIEVTNPVGYKKLALFHAFNFTIPGIPVVYYGDEIGLTGGNDPDCRRMMRFSNLKTNEKQLFNTVKLLAGYRKTHLEMIYGEFIEVQVTDQTWVYARRYFDKESIVFLNNSAQAKTFKIALPKHLQGRNLKVMHGNDFKIKNNDIILTLKPYDFEILH